MRLEGSLGDVFRSKKRKALEDAELLANLRDETALEKGDNFALIIAALITIVPVAIVILLLYYFISMAVFG